MNKNKNRETLLYSSKVLKFQAILKNNPLKEIKVLIICLEKLI